MNEDKLFNKGDRVTLNLDRYQELWGGSPNIKNRVGTVKGFSSPKSGGTNIAGNEHWYHVLFDGVKTKYRYPESVLKKA
jgi:hypothetical protein